MSSAPLVLKADEDLVEVWPLHLLNLDDEEHFDLVFKLLYRVPAVIHHYLSCKAAISHLVHTYKNLISSISRSFPGSHATPGPQNFIIRPRAWR
jgi:hypothetical protein